MTQHYPPGQQFPPYSPYPPQPVIVVKNSMATAAMVLGILALLFSWIPIIGVIAWPLLIVGIVLGLIGLAKARRGAPGTGVAITGLVTSGLALVICMIYVLAIGSAASSSATSPARLAPTSARIPAAAVPAAPAAPAAPAGPAATIGDGTYQVGTDIVAGRYKTPGPPADSIINNCYWQRTKDDSGEFGSIISNGNAAGPGSVTVKKGEFFESSGGCTWTKQ